MKNSKSLKNNWNYIVVFLIPWILIIAHSFVRGSWLSGQGSILSGDTELQIYPLFVELWNKVHSGSSLFFSWNAGSGFDFYLNFVYYLISPFNLIILLLPKSCLANGVQFVMVLKWSLMGVAMTYYLMHTRHNTLTANKRFVSMVLGLVYVLSDSMLVFLGYLNWGDVMILFPILLLLLENLIDNGEWKWYYILLTVCMFCNFYTTHQVCIFLLIWFLLNLQKDTGLKLQRFLCFAGSSLLAALTSLVVILPAVLGVAGRYSSDNISGKNLAFVKMILNSIYDFGGRSFFMNGKVAVVDSYQANVYISVGALTLVLLFLFLAGKERDNIKLIVLGLFMTMSLSFGALSFVWHGFSVPNGIFHRFLYIFVFVMLFIALQTIQKLDGLKLWHMIAVLLMQGVFYVLAFFHIEVYEDFFGYLITFLLLIFYIILGTLYVRKSIKRESFVLVFLSLMMVELCGNGFYELRAYSGQKWEDKENNSSAIALLQNLPVEQGERVNTLQCSNNMGLHEGMSNTNAFVSYCNGDMVRLFQSLGLDYVDDASYMLYGSSPLTNVMFNVRYGVGNSACGFSDAALVDSAGDMKLYRMENLAGLGYMVDEKISDFDLQTALDFDLQNQFVRLATNGEDIFETITPEVTFTDSLLQYKYDERYHDFQYFYYDYISANVASNEFTRFSFVADEDMDLYLDAFCDKTMKNFIFVDDTRVAQDTDVRYQGMYHIGSVKKGQEIAVYSQHSMGVGEEAKLWFRLAKFDENNYRSAYEKLSENTYQIDEMSASYVSGSIHADADGIMMTSVPAMDGFTVYVDGDKTEAKAIGGVFFGVPLSTGDHRVEFKYRTPYFVQGLVGSLFGLLIFAILCLIGCPDCKIFEFIFCRLRIRKAINKYYGGLSEVNDEIKDIRSRVGTGIYRTFSYDFTKKYNVKNKIVFDEECEMNYILHHGKRMYFKKGMTKRQANTYYNQICMEQDEASPHNYFNFLNMEKYRVVLDLGAAEGIFALEIIDRAEKVYLFECDEGWIEALNKTFETWSDKIEIMNYFVGDGDGGSITLDSILEDENNIDLIKMDIEGSEKNAICGMKKIMDNNTELRMLICTYHNQDDEMEIREALKDWDLKTSKGYMLFFEDENQKPPYFRRGLIYGSRKK